MAPSDAEVRCRHAFEAEGVAYVWRNLARKLFAGASDDGRRFGASSVWKLFDFERDGRDGP